MFLIAPYLTNRLNTNRRLVKRWQAAGLDKQSVSTILFIYE
jgi:hypothetical protein